MVSGCAGSRSKKAGCFQNLKIKPNRLFINRTDGFYYTAVKNQWLFEWLLAANFAE